MWCCFRSFSHDCISQLICTFFDTSNFKALRAVTLDFRSLTNNWLTQMRCAHDAKILNDWCEDKAQTLCPGLVLVSICWIQIGFGVELKGFHVGDARVKKLMPASKRSIGRHVEF